MPLRVLVVDDNLDTLRVYRRAILRGVKPVKSSVGVQLGGEEADNVEVGESDSVLDALAKMRSSHYDLLVVDLKIPGTSGDEMGGLELVTESLSNDPLRPIIIITGYGTIELARSTFTKGVFDFIEKSTTAVDDLVDSVHRAIKSRKDKLLRSGNPFTPMTGVEPTVFGGRVSELEFFERHLDRAINGPYSEHFLVLGNWGIGKSTIFSEFKKICRSRGYLATLVRLEPFQTSTRLIDVAHSIVEGILRDLPFSIDKFERLCGYFESVGINVLGTGFQLRRDTSKKEVSPQSFLFDSLKNLWEDIEGKYQILVILLDDLDNLAPVSEIIMTLKQTLSLDRIRSAKILMGISSTQSNWNEITGIKKHHPLSRYFLSHIELAPLAETDLRETVIRSLAGTGVTFSAEILSRVYQLSRGHPFEMQVLCYHLFNNQLSQKVDMELWDKAVESTLSDLGAAVFDHWRREASPEEGKVLRAIADAESNLSVNEIHVTLAKKKIKISAMSITKYLQRLVDKRLVERVARGQYTISDGMFRAYLKFREPW